MEKSRMRPNQSTCKTSTPPGTWSTDDYIRRWARNHGMAQGECVIPLQSLQDEWTARIHFDRQGEPVERIAQSAEVLLAA